MLGIDPRIILTGGIIGVYMTSVIADGVVERAALSLDAPVRARVGEREMRAARVWRTLEFLAMLIMSAGFLTFFMGRLTLGYRIAAAGVLLMGFSVGLHGWMTHASFAAEAPGTRAKRQLLMAAVVVTIAELFLAGVVFVVAFKSLFVPTHSNKTAPVQGQEETPVESGKPEEPPPPVWVDESEALKLLPDRNSVYLKALAKRQDVRFGEKGYLRDDIVKLKAAGLPTEEELGLDKPEKEKSPLKD